METIYVNRFDGGVVNDPRTQSTGTCRTCTNFDALTNPHKITPYFDSESGDSSASTRQIKNFLIAPYNGTYVLMGLGLDKDGTGTHYEVWSKSLSTGGSGDLGDAAWSSMTNATSTSVAANFNFFVYYKNQGKVYIGANGKIIIFTPDASTAFDDTGHSLSYTTIAQGLVHSKDDIMYVPYDNKIASLNASTWTDAALTLPTNQQIVSICELGNYLAIGCKDVSGVGRSTVYLWDRNSTLLTISETIDWGDGALAWIKQLNGVLVGCSVLTGVDSAFKNRVIFRQYTGAGSAEKFLELEGATGVGTVGSTTHLVNARIYFMMQVSLNGATREGVWSIGRPSGSGTYTLFHERTPNNDTALVNGLLYNFFHVEGILLQSYLSNTAVGMSKTNDQASYTATSIIESTVNPGMANSKDRILKKRIYALGASYEPLTSGQQVVMKYRADGGAWTTLFTETTTGQVVSERVNDATGAAITDGREFEFRLESTGGAVITGYSYRYDIMKTLI